MKSISKYFAKALDVFALAVEFEFRLINHGAMRFAQVKTLFARHPILAKRQGISVYLILLHGMMLCPNLLQAIRACHRILHRT
jgi:hypothetical protein